MTHEEKLMEMSRLAGEAVLRGERGRFYGLTEKQRAFMRKAEEELRAEVEAERAKEETS